MSSNNSYFSQAPGVHSGWTPVTSGLPTCGDGRLFIGINTVGFAGVFNDIVDMGGSVWCMYETAEDSVEILTDLSMWAVLRLPYPPPSAYVYAAGIIASDMPGTVVRKLDAAFYDAVAFHCATPALPAIGDASAGDLAEGPAGSGGWKVHAESMEKECAYWKTTAKMMRAHACKDVWYWQGDGSDNPATMVNSLAVVIRADQLRDLLAQHQAEPALYVSRGQLENHTDPDGDGGKYLPARRTPLGLLNYPLYTAPQAQPAFQQRVQPWMMECFGAEIAADRIERNHRFLEEALELVQATGCTQSEAHQLVDYVYGRPWGEPAQEVGGVMVTLAALCLANGLDMHQAGEKELARIWTKVEAIHAKQAAKPKHSPLPQAQPADALDAARWRALLACGRIRLFGTAGVNGSGIHDPSQLTPHDEPYGNYVHFGAEFWSTFPDQDYYNTKENPVYARATLTEFADACRAAMAAAQEGGKA